MPRSNVTPGNVRASANATPSKVLWLSFLTITSHGRSLPEPGPVERGFCFRTGGATVLMDSSVTLPCPAPEPCQAGFLVPWRDGSLRHHPRPWLRRRDPAAHPGVGVPGLCPERRDERPPSSTPTET